jgi:succinate dehydrogenase / fumarate reductase, cytochrome b subunit
LSHPEQERGGRAGASAPDFQELFMKQVDLHGRRPVSPHLQIYRLTPTMAMSIAHRITGMGLYLGIALLVLWLFAAASGPRYYDAYSTLATGWFGLLALFVFTWILLHHMLGGIRYLIWDTGKWTGRSSARRLALWTLIGSVSLTLLVWIIVFFTR